MQSPTNFECDNPYVGLRPFDTDDSLLFFGRREQVAELLERLYDGRFLVVVGSSGCGKSSLIRAGLIPALLGGFLVEERPNWRIATMRPGDRPINKLARALSDALETRSRTEIERFHDDIHTRLLEAVIEYVSDRLKSDENLLLLIDQLEELFGDRGDDKKDLLLDLIERREQARRRAANSDFVDLILALAAQRRLPVYVVLTMRSEYLGECDRFYGLPEAVNRGQYLVPRLSRQQLADAIEGPARLGGTEISPQLRDILLNELGDRPDRLPVLQHALLRTYGNWKSKNVSEKDTVQVYYQHYMEIGGLEKALSKHAEEAIVKPDLEVTARIFKSITDTDPQRRRTRRISSITELVKVSEAARPKVEEILKRFREGGRHFVVVGGDGDDSRVDLSHESLIRQWVRLRTWVDEEADARDQFLELVRRARDKQGPPLVGVDLMRAQQWREKNKPNPKWAVRYGVQEDFSRAIDYIEESERRETWKKLGIYVAIVGLIAAVFVSIFYYISNERNKKARERVERALTREREAREEVHRNLRIAQETEEQLRTALFRATVEQQENDESQKQPNATEDRVISSSPEARGLWEEGLARSKKGDQNGAKRKFKDALLIDKTYAPALISLGRIALSNDDYKGAARKFRKAVEHAGQYIPALSNLAWYYYRIGYYTLAEDYLKKIKRLDEDHESVNKLRKALDDQYKKDKPRNKMWKQACDDGILDSCVEYGKSFEHGRGGEGVDRKRARKYYEQACSRRNARGCHELADVWEDGEGVQKNPEKAKYFYEKACELGYEKSCKRLSKYQR